MHNPGRNHKVGAGAFRNCSSLTNATLPNGVSKVGKDVFKGCSSLGTVSPQATPKAQKTIKSPVVTVTIKGTLLIFEYCSKSLINEESSFHDNYYATYLWLKSSPAASITATGEKGQKMKRALTEKLLKAQAHFRELLKADGPHPLPVAVRARKERDAVVTYRIEMKEGEGFDMDKLELAQSFLELAQLKQGIVADYIQYDGRQILAECNIIELSVEDLYHSAEHKLDIEKFI